MGPHPILVLPFSPNLRPFTLQLNDNFERLRVAEEPVRARTVAVGAGLHDHHQVARPGHREVHAVASRSSGVHSGPTTEARSRGPPAIRVPMTTG